MRENDIYDHLEHFSFEYGCEFDLRHKLSWFITNVKQYAQEKKNAGI